jgi:hypothetical protein
MSRTFSLVCHGTKQKICIGQGGMGEDQMDSFYSGAPEIMVRLGRFLEATRGKSLVLLRDDPEREEEELCDYEEFEEDK